MPESPQTQVDSPSIFAEFLGPEGTTAPAQPLAAPKVTAPATATGVEEGSSTSTSTSTSTSAPAAKIVSAPAPVVPTSEPSPKPPGTTEVIEKEAEGAEEEPLPEGLSDFQKSLLGNVVGNPQAGKSRDYSLFSDEERAVAKKLPNDAFGVMLRLKQQAQEAQKPVSIDPESYVLTPEFRELDYGVNLAAAAEDHWAEQLKLARAGKDWTPLGTNSKGELVALAQKRQASPDAEVEIMKNLAFAQQQAVILEKKREDYAAGFKQSASKQLATIAEVEKRHFAMYENPTPEVKTQLDQVGKALAELGINKRNPAYSLLQKSAALNFQLVELVKTLRTTAGKNATTVQNQVKAGPTSRAGGASAGTFNPAEEFKEFL